MTHRFQNYSDGYRVVSIAISDHAMSDLINEPLDFLAIDESTVVLQPMNKVLTTDPMIISSLLAANDYDVFEIWPDGRFFRYYDNSSIENYFFVTAKCNSNCIMCPSPEAARKNGQHTNIADLIEIARHIPSYTAHLTITGGEPFLVGKSIFPFVSFLRDKFDHTEFLFLTNGRVFSIPSYIELLKENAPNNSIFAIPIHASFPDLHDHITRAPGSFVQTLNGIKNLLGARFRVELRIVVSRLNVANFSKIAELIVAEIPDVEYVSVIGMEMTGNAHREREQLWIPYTEVASKISDGIMHLIQNGINVKLYNFPLCTVQPKYRPLCEKSISSEKVRYAEVCDTCTMKSACGGVFAGTFKLEKDELRAIL